MKLPGKISISRSTGPDGHSFVVTIHDARSGVQFLEATVSLEDFAMALTGVAERSCDLNLRGLDVLGKLREIKHEVIEIPEKFRRPRLSDDAAAVDEIVAPFEVDGWMCHSRNDLWNGHRRERGTERYRVGFVRYVDAPDGYVDPDGGRE